MFRVGDTVKIIKPYGFDEELKGKIGTVHYILYHGHEQILLIDFANIINTLSPCTVRSFLDGATAIGSTDGILKQKTGKWYEGNRISRYYLASNVNFRIR